MMFDVYSVDYYFTVSADNSAVSDLSEFEDHKLCVRIGQGVMVTDLRHYMPTFPQIAFCQDHMVCSSFFFTDIFLVGIV